jgi:hypothetical protein
MKIGVKTPVITQKYPYINAILMYAHVNPSKSLALEINIT